MAYSVFGTEDEIDLGWTSVRIQLTCKSTASGRAQRACAGAGRVVSSMEGAWGFKVASVLRKSTAGGQANLDSWQLE